MKVTITSFGILEITSESSLEDYALKKFYSDTVINANDLQRNEREYLRGSKIEFITTESKIDDKPRTN